MLIKVFTFLLSFGGCLYSEFVSASNYPDTHTLYSDLPVKVGPVKVFWSFQQDHSIRLSISYDGSLKNYDILKATIRVKYLDGHRDASFPMVRVQIQDEESFHLVEITNGCLIGMLGGCHERGSDVMKNLLYWAVRGGHSPGLNGLDLEIAIDAGNGVWDSGPDSQNYQFHFNERLLNWSR